MQDENTYRRETEIETETETSLSLSASLLTRCHTLLAEIDTFRDLLEQTQRNPQVVEARSIRSSVLSELRTLERLDAKVREVNERYSTSLSVEREGDDRNGMEGERDDEEEQQQQEQERRLLHTLRSSNLPFYEAVWNVAKGSCTGLAAFGKRFYCDGDPGQLLDNGDDEDSGSRKPTKKPGKDKRKGVFVDIVADDGEEWVKVSTVSETRLLFEMAHKGWEADSEDDYEGSDGGNGRTVLRNFDGDEDDDDEDEIELIKLAADMRKAANATRVRYRHPRLRIVIPKIEEGKSSEVDDLLKVIKSYGVTVDCGEKVFGSFVPGMVRAASTADDLRHLLPTPFKRFTPSLNVDCTLLLAVVSDLSNVKDILLSPSHHRAIVRQLEVEKDRPLLPTELWPAMDAHGLVCTDEAAKRMREIVDVIGTESEKKRTEIMMGDPPFNDCDSATLVQKFQEMSDYEVPVGWKLPIKTVDARPAIESVISQGKLPLVSHKMDEILSSINYSVFMYGWAAGIVTISSNRTVAKEIETTIEKHRNSDEDLIGPDVWVCDTARSLAGKEKGRR